MDRFTTIPNQKITKQSLDLADTRKHENSG